MLKSNDKIKYSQGVKEFYNSNNTKFKAKRKKKTSLLIKREEITPIRGIGIFCALLGLFPFIFTFFILAYVIFGSEYIDPLLLRIIIGCTFFGLISFSALAAIICQRWLLYFLVFFFIGLLYFVDIGTALFIVHYHPKFVTSAYIYAYACIVFITTVPCCFIFFVNCREDKIEQESKYLDEMEALEADMKKHHVTIGTNNDANSKVSTRAAPQPIPTKMPVPPSSTNTTNQSSSTLPESNPPQQSSNPSPECDPEDEALLL